ncbi:hypothetical protein BCR32DRAFT_290291 [Anaeromyces robustus]|uniref:AP-3 complex subunit beta n=1 Tax=Anaeromyces robustus TaxID=1754192 RepID=A0A1Y1XK16_9FUNG|nr:hypothetical protein BCR32DRAFT_290291 [Anaeromyces robustus]|eukprot:ORX86065.1 hypothetical protein BCR32DRAFT_290291 [Anaeromyces robustus]
MNIGSVSASNSNVQKIGTVAYSIAKEAAKFSKKFSEEIVEKSREYSQSTQLYDKYHVDVDAIKELLDSKYEAEKIEGLKRAVGFIAKGRDCSALFPSVVKNVAVNSLEVKRLVYDYLIRYASTEQELALLAVNTFQKELSDKNPEVRALAIRVMSSIKIPAIMTILLQGIKKTLKDDSILVRQAAVNSLIKCYQMDPENKPVYVELVTSALKEGSPYVIGNVINAFNKICPERLDLIHPHYRRLCFLLIDVDGWGQLAILDLLLKYGKCQFKCPYNDDNNKKQDKTNDNNTNKLDSFFNNDNDEMFYNSEENVDKDLRLLLDCCKPVLQTYNIAVVLKIVTIFYYLAPRNEFKGVALNLLRYVTKSYEQQYLVLQTILPITNKMPDIYRPHIKSFFINKGSPYYIKELQMKIIVNLTDVHNSNLVYNEFYSYIRNEDPKFVILTMEAIATLTKKIPVLAELFLRLLLSRIMSKNEQVSAECIIVIRKLLQIYPEDNSETVKYLAKILPSITVPKAKANLLWLIGQYCQSIVIIVPDILRTFAKSFTKEDLQVKYQILNMGAKLVSVDPQPHNLLLFEYVLKLARYDINYDLRDKARFYKALILDQIRKFIPKQQQQQEKKENNNNTESKKEENKKEEEKEENEKEKEDDKKEEKEEKEESKNENEDGQKKEDKKEENITTTEGKEDNEDIEKDEISLDENENENENDNENEMNILNSKSLDELLVNLQKLLIGSNSLTQHSNSNIEDENERYTLGSLSHSVNCYVKGYEPLPDWPETTLNSSARQDYFDEHTEKSFSSNDKRFKNFAELHTNPSSSITTIKTSKTNSTANKRYITLDDFYNEDDDDEDDDSEEETEEDSEEESEKESEEESEEESEDDDEENDEDDDEDDEEEDDDDDDDDDDEEEDDDDENDEEIKKK